MPAALIAPTRPETGQQEVEPPGLDVQRDGVAVRAVDALGQDIKEEDGRDHAAKDEETADDQYPQHDFQHRAFSFASSFIDASQTLRDASRLPPSPRRTRHHSRFAR